MFFSLIRTLLTSLPKISNYVVLDWAELLNSFTSQEQHGCCSPLNNHDFSLGAGTLEKKQHWSSLNMKEAHSGYWGDCQKYATGYKVRQTVLDLG